MNQIDLKDEVAVITGGAQGIGLTVAKSLLASGAKISLWDIDKEMLKQAKTKLSNFTQTCKVDITRILQVEKAAKKVEKIFGKISILVNSAGIAGPTKLLDEYKLHDWKRVIDVNLNGTFFVNRTIVPYMKKFGYGRIVNIASIAGKEGNPNASAYSASKAAVIGLTKSLGKELANYDIAVNCVTPAAARTRIFDQISSKHIKYMLSKIPRQRFAELDEISAMITWLVSRENSFTTAGVFDLSGGRATY